MRVVVVGAWHLGAVAAAVNAQWDRQVTVWDRDPGVRDAIRRHRALVREPGLDDLLSANAPRLDVTDTPDDAIGAADTMLIAYDTPVNERDELDLAVIEQAMDLIARHARAGALVVLHSQVPVGYTSNVETELARAGRGDLLMTVTPENLQLGNAVRAFQAPSHLAIGANSGEADARARQFWAPTGAEMISTNPSTAEMSKHLINATLATCTALGNELGDLAARASADPIEAALLAKRDARLARLPIVPGLPVGGGTLARDLRLVATMAGPSSLAQAVVDSGDARYRSMLESLRRSNGPIALLGLTYKPGTSATRRSIGVSLAHDLATGGAAVRVFDADVPGADNPLKDVPGVSIRSTAADAISGARTIAITTAHAELRDAHLVRDMDHPGVTIHDLVGLLPRGQDTFQSARYMSASASVNSA